jgi:hypothetical protein
MQVRKIYYQNIIRVTYKVPTCLLSFKSLFKIYFFSFYTLLNMALEIVQNMLVLK